MADHDARDNASSDVAVRIRGARKRFGAREVVRGVDLTVPAGTAYGYLGPNGAGKTTLLRMLLGLLRFEAGEMEILGHRLPGQRAEALRHVGAIVEEPSFYRHLSGRDNLRVAAAARGPEAFAQIDAALERVGLAARKDERVKGYSLGMRQRLGIARCLIADPRLLVLDEPLNGLDPGGIQEFRALIRSLVADGCTILLSSHLLAEVERTCDHVAIVDDGRVVMSGSIAELTAGGSPTVTVDARTDLARAEALLTAVSGVRTVMVDERAPAGSDGWLTLEVTVEGADVAPALNRALVSAAVEVRRLEPRAASLEQRFMELTTRLGDAS